MSSGGCPGQSCGSASTRLPTHVPACAAAPNAFALQKPKGKQSRSLVISAGPGEGGEAEEDQMGKVQGVVPGMPPEPPTPASAPCRPMHSPFFVDQLGAAALHLRAGPAAGLHSCDTGQGGGGRQYSPAIGRPHTAPRSAAHLAQYARALLAPRLLPSRDKDGRIAADLLGGSSGWVARRSPGRACPAACRCARPCCRARARHDLHRLARLRDGAARVCA